MRLHPFIRDANLARSRVHVVLNAAFALSFGVQLILIGFLTATATVLVGRQDNPNEILSWVLIGAAFLHLMLGVLVLSFGLQSTVRQRARAISPKDAEAPVDQKKMVQSIRQGGLSRALLGAILLTIPGWFLAFAWLTGQTQGTLAAIGLALVLGYLLGLFQMRPLARALSELRVSAPQER